MGDNFSWWLMDVMRADQLPPTYFTSIEFVVKSILFPVIRNHRLDDRESSASETWTRLEEPKAKFFQWKDRDGARQF